MKPQPLIAVRDVEASSAWYRRLLGCQSGHGGREYEQLVRDGELLMQLHHWGDHDHPNLGDPNAAPPVMASCSGSKPMALMAPSQTPARSARASSSSRM